MAELVLIGLIPTTEGKNEIGRPIEIRKPPKEIYADKKSVRQSEFYQAAATGFKPEIVFEIWEFEYEDESLVTYMGKEYRVIRTFEKGNSEKIELICSGIVNEVG